MNCFNINTNVNGIPYLRTTGVTVGTDAVDYQLGFRRIPAVSYLTINLSDAIPTGTTTTLPIRFTLNGNIRTLTLLGGTNVTVADVGTGIITVFYDWYNGILQLVSPTV